MLWPRLIHQHVQVDVGLGLLGRILDLVGLAHLAQHARMAVLSTLVARMRGGARSLGLDALTELKQSAAALGLSRNKVASGFIYRR